MTRRLQVVRALLSFAAAGIGVGAWHAHLHQLLTSSLVDGGGRFFS